MYDEISSESKQNFIVLSFQERQDVDSLITVLDSNDNPLMSYKSDRVYTNLVYSSSNLSNGTYYLYKDGNIDGSSNNGLYLKINSYTKGIQLGYTNNITGGMQGGKDNMTPPDMNNDFNHSGDNSMNSNNMSGGSASNQEFVIDGISNLFSGVGKLVEE